MPRRIMEGVNTRTRMLVCSLVLLSFGTVGCKRTTDRQGSNVRTFDIRGRVVSADPRSNEIMLAHDAVPGFMEAMTMPYRTSTPQAIKELHPGDTITARLTVSTDSDGDFHNPGLDRIVIVGQARPDTVPDTQYHALQAGDVVPDFAFLDQSGHNLRLAQLRGKAVLLTFIYTRCPLSDFCPKMSRNFAEIDKALAANPAVYDKTDLLSISFDPAYDNPAVLRSYGGAYTGRYTKEDFHHWQFAAPQKAELPKVEQYFDVGVTGSGTSITHSMSTVLIAPDGKVAQWYPGNEWSPAEVAQAMAKMAQQS